MPEHCFRRTEGVRRRVRLALGSIVVAAFAGAAVQAETSADRAERLERLVVQDCGSCHGMTLKGGLGPDIRAATLNGWSREDLIAVILDGVPDTPMPPWRPLITGEDAAWIADYLLNGGRP